ALAAAEPLQEELAGEPQPLWLFGAGHVGRAIVRALAPLPFAVCWVDGRPGIFPHETPDNATVEPCDPPWQAVARAPSGAFFLTMTHKHESDYAVCEAVLRRGDAAYLGMIGSDAKRERGLRWLADKGLSAAQIARVTCPIGLPGIEGKEPAVIAAAVAADLLLRREARLQEMEGAA
ncbi:MAG: xanthine dehydrogenase accessory protein XdhC, partial [Kiloniellales bacterium]